jgi:ATP-dependent Clp protease ATP-binding subunit ClpA
MLSVIGLEVNNEAKDWLADTGYSPMYGARPLKRLLHKELLTPLSKQMLSGAFKPGDTIHVTKLADAASLRLD